MAFRKKGWRKIVVESRVFYWQGADLLWNVPLFTFRVRPELEPQRLLIVRCDQCGHQSQAFFCAVTPQIVRGCIEAGILSGWLGSQPRLQSVLFSTPFRLVAVDPAWLTSDVLALASGIYEDRAYDRMPILADALQDAGCENQDVLNHCRQSGEHVRGCWVIDLLTGKE